MMSSFFIAVCALVIAAIGCAALDTGGGASYVRVLPRGVADWHPTKPR